MCDHLHALQEAEKCNSPKPPPNKKRTSFPPLSPPFWAKCQHQSSLKAKILNSDGRVRFDEGCFAVGIVLKKWRAQGPASLQEVVCCHSWHQRWLGLTRPAGKPPKPTFNSDSILPSFGAFCTPGSLLAWRNTFMSQAFGLTDGAKGSSKGVQLKA